MKKTATIELFPNNRAAWIINSGDSEIVGTGTHAECLSAMVAHASASVVVIPEFAEITPIFTAHPNNSWWRTNTLPSGAWVYPTRSLPSEKEYLVIENFGAEFSDFVSLLVQNKIPYTIDIGTIHREAPGIHIRIGNKKTTAQLTSGGVPLASNTAHWGTDNLHPIITDTAGVTNPLAILSKYGLQRTHHDPNLLNALVTAVIDGIAPLRTLAHLHAQPYQHPWLLQKPQWVFVETATPVPGLAEFIAAHLQLEHITIPKTYQTADMLAARLLQRR